MAKKIPLGVEMHFEKSKPFVAVTPNGKTVILQSESLFNAHGDIITYTEVVLEDEPTEAEIFKVTLQNPEQETQIAWGVDCDEAKKGYIGTPPNRATIPWQSTEEVVLFDPTYIPKQP